MNKPKKYPLALNLPTVVALLIIYGRHVVQAIGANPQWFATPSPALNIVTADLDALEASEAMTKNGTKGLADARDLKLKTVEDDLKALKAFVASVIALNPTQAGVIANAAGMELKRTTTRGKDPIAARMGKSLGQVLLVAKAAAKRASYDWQSSSDGGKTWVSLPSTNTASTSVEGLVAGTTYAFRVRSTVKNVVSDWSAAINFVVH
jgi:hypothetical protein